ncbi:MAG: hypothetical protein ACREQ5_36110, partial [Candidatus Dormibacteria bacterium]
MANPSSQDGKKSNRLWEAIKKKNGGLLNRTLVVLSAASLRSAGFYIDQQAAQETIAEDLVRWLKSSKDFPLDKDFALPAHLIVRFDFDTVFHFCFDSTQNNSKIDIYSRPFHVDPQSNEDLYGKMPGYGRILVASIVQCLAKSFPTPSNQLDLKVIRNGICDGLRRAAAHFRNGFVSKEFGEKYSKPSTHSPSPFENLFKFDLDLDLEFLFKSYTRDDYNNIGNPKEDKPKFPLIAKISIPWANLVAEKKELKSFSRVESLKKSLGETTFDEFLNDVVKKGLDKALKDENYKEHNSKDYKDLISLPFLTLGKLISVDRDEIYGISDLY